MCETRTPVSITATMGEPATTPQRGAMCGAEWAGTAVPTTNAATAAPRHMSGAFDARADIPAIRSPGVDGEGVQLLPRGVCAMPTPQHETGLTDGDNAVHAVLKKIAGNQALCGA